MRCRIRQFGLMCFAALGLSLPPTFSFAEDAPAKPAPAKVEPAKVEPAKLEKPKIEIAILLDTSGSMDGLIDQARNQLWKIVNEFSSAQRAGQSPVLHVALYEYGKATLPASEGWVRMIVPLTTDLDKISEELFALETNGGEEYCGQVIDRAVTELAWSKNPKDLKCIFIAGNEPFDQGPIDFRKSCAKAAAANITVSTIHCGDLEEGARTFWAEGAKLADGSYMSINHNAVVPHIEAPQDAELAKLSAEVNKTYVAYGAKAEREVAQQRQIAQDENAKKSNAGVAAARAAFKGSGLYSNAQWDLVDACKDGKLKIEDVKEEDLPEELKKLKPEQRKAHVEKMAQQRAEIQENIKKLSAEREAYIAEQRKNSAEKSDNTLDQAVIDAARKQAERLEFEFKKAN